MNEKTLASQFDHDLNQILAGRSRSQSEGLSGDYEAVLGLAEQLLQIDFSSESRLREATRRNLMTKHVPTKEQKMTTLMQPLLTRRRLSLMVGVALVILMMTMLAHPGGPVAAAQSIQNGVKLIILGAYSTAQQIEAGVTGKPAPDDEWTIQLFPGYGVGGNGLPGTDPTVVVVSSFTEAQELVTFDLKEPAYLPEGYSLRDIQVAPVANGPGAALFPYIPDAYAFYQNGEGLIVIVQSPIGPQATTDPNTVVGQVSGFATNGTLQEVTFNGHVAAWANDKLLMWEVDNLSYVVGGPTITLDEAIRIAQSLE